MSRTIRDAAARLFTTQGYAATSTREIAEAVELQQASLYYHYAGKPAILAAILADTVRPTLERLPAVEELAVDDPATALYLLAVLDVRTLAEAPHNAGLLYRHPDVMSCEECADFRGAHAELVAGYGRLGNAVVDEFGDAELLGALLIQAVETVVSLQAAGRYDEARTPDQLAGALLRICGLSADEIVELAAAAALLLPQLVEELAAA